MKASSYLELVCPAGTPAALRAAVDAGADTVYCGLRDSTNARNYPGLNFDPDELPKAWPMRIRMIAAFWWPSTRSRALAIRCLGSGRSTRRRKLGLTP